MQNQQVFSTQKIIVLVVFVCAALMTSVFLVHMRHKTTENSLSANEGTMFSAARDIKSFDLLAANHQAFSQKNLLTHWTLLFFGFAHCSSVCPTTFDMMNRAYNKLHTAYPNLQIVFVSLDPERDTPESLAQYAHSFNPDFVGVTGKIQELRKLQSQFGIFSARDDATEKNYQIQHTASIMLINPQGKWTGMFNFGMNPNQFANAFAASMQSLSLRNV